jgi:hypothetical protein
MYQFEAKMSKLLSRLLATLLKQSRGGVAFTYPNIHSSEDVVFHLLKPLLFG